MVRATTRGERVLMLIHGVCRYGAKSLGLNGDAHGPLIRTKGRHEYRYYLTGSGRMMLTRSLDRQFSDLLP